MLAQRLRQPQDYKELLKSAHVLFDNGDLDNAELLARSSIAARPAIHPPNFFDTPEKLLDRIRERREQLANPNAQKRSGLFPNIRNWIFGNETKEVSTARRRSSSISIRSDCQPQQPSGGVGPPPQTQPQPSPSPIGPQSPQVPPPQIQVLPLPPPGGAPSGGLPLLPPQSSHDVYSSPVAAAVTHQQSGTAA